MSDQISREQFYSDLVSSISKYFSTPHFKPGVELPPTEVIVSKYAHSYDSWSKVKLEIDRMSLLFKVLDDFYVDELHVWQKMERYLIDRYAIEAFMLSENEIVDPSDPDFCNILTSKARVLFVLTQYEYAQKLALLAYNSDPNNRRCRTILADILMYSESHENHKAAHALYLELLKDKIPVTDKQVKLPFNTLINFEDDIVCSPIYAIDFLKECEENGQNDIDNLWEFANNEFYYSPQFRTQYAYQLISKGDKQNTMKGFVKLLVTSREMPWFKEAVINAFNLMQSLDLSESFPEDKKRLAQIIQENEWTADTLN